MTDLSRRSFLAAAGAVALSPLARGAGAAPKFQLGLISYNVAAQWDLPTVLGVCKRVGITGFEARTTHKHGVEPTLTADQRKDVKKQFADSGVAFWGSGSACEFHSADAAVVAKNIEDTKKFIDLTKDLGGKGVKVRPNGLTPGKTPEQTCEQIGKALAACGKAAADAGVEIWVEVHGKETSQPALVKRMLDVCGHPAVGACWNSNPTDLIDGSIAASFDLLAKHIKHCHINDLTNDKAGKYPYRDLFKRLAGIGYDRYTMCEYGKSFDPAEGEKFLKEYKALWTELANG